VTDELAFQPDGVSDNAQKDRHRDQNFDHGDDNKPPEAKIASGHALISATADSSRLKPLGTKNLENSFGTAEAVPFPKAKAQERKPLTDNR
jgi:hypothetical protein